MTKLHAFGIGLIVGLVIASTGYSSHDEFTKQQVVPEVVIVTEQPIGPKITLTVKDFVDMLAIYSVKHEHSGLMDYLQYWGLTDPDTKTVFINDRGDIGITKDTVIHEMLHIAYYQLGYDSRGDVWEALIRARTTEIYKELYGSR